MYAYTTKHFRSPRPKAQTVGPEQCNVFSASHGFSCLHHQAGNARSSEATPGHKSGAPSLGPRYLHPRSRKYPARAWVARSQNRGFVIVWPLIHSLPPTTRQKHFLTGFVLSSAPNSLSLSHPCRSRSSRHLAPG